MKAKTMVSLFLASILVTGASGCSENKPAVNTTTGAVTSESSAETTTSTTTSSTTTTVVSDTPETVLSTNTERSSTPDIPLSIVTENFVSTEGTVEDTMEDTTVTSEPADVPVFTEDFSYQRYLDLMLDYADSPNCVFSPESINIAYAIYDELLVPEGQENINKFLGGKPYLEYQSTDVFHIVNRLWYNSNLPFHIENSSVLSELGLGYGLDMSDSEAATNEKNQFVSDNTNGFIDSTPSVFDSETLFDAMNIVYFKDMWLDGDLYLDSEESDFTNFDGSVSKVHMMHDSRGAVYGNGKAISYSLPYNDGFKFTAVLPMEDVDIRDVGIDDFVNHNVELMYNDVRFCMPEFECKNIYQLTNGSFGLPEYNLNPDIYSGSTDPAVISQVARIRVDHEGTEAAAVSEIIKAVNAITPVSDPFYFVCDRPFVYVITDTLNNDIAFIGVVNTMNE